MIDLGKHRPTGEQAVLTYVSNYFLLVKLIVYFHASNCIVQDILFNLILRNIFREYINNNNNNYKIILHAIKFIPLLNNVSLF